MNCVAQRRRENPYSSMMPLCRTFKTGVAKRKDRRERCLTTAPSTSSSEWQAMVFVTWYIPCSTSETRKYVLDEISTLGERSGWLTCEYSMRENHHGKLDMLLGHRRFHPADPDLAERIILKAQRVRRAKQRHLRSGKRRNLPQASRVAERD